jgi:hypothetical protein
VPAGSSAGLGSSNIVLILKKRVVIIRFGRIVGGVGWLSTGNRGPLSLAAAPTKAPIDNLQAVFDFPP